MEDHHELLLRYGQAIDEMRKAVSSLFVCIAILKGQLTEQEIAEYQKRGDFILTQEGKR